MADLSELLPYCKTETQEKYLQAVIEHGSCRAAAKALGLNKDTVASSLERIRRHAATRGHAPESHLNFPVPAGQMIRGTSTLIDKRDNTTVLQWVKTSADQEKLAEIQREVIDALKEELPRYEPVKHPQITQADLLTLYTISDYHLGMKAWSSETGGDDWDLHLADELLSKWVSLAVDRSPQSARGVLCLLGDFLHWDGMDAVTPTHGHLLDADTRFQKLIRVAIRVIRRAIHLLAEKHKYVHVIYADANHDPASGAWMREWLSAVYEGDDRITVETSADSYYCVEHGLTSLFFHHGHRKKIESLDEVFAAKFREVFGRTKFSYGHTGHLHHNELRESVLMQVERHRTLAPADAYAAKGGWISGRDAKVITYHKLYGEVERVTISPDLVKA